MKKFFLIVIVIIFQVAAQKVQLIGIEMSTSNQNPSEAYLNLTIKLTQDGPINIRYEKSYIQIGIGPENHDTHTLIFDHSLRSWSWKNNHKPKEKYASFVVGLIKKLRNILSIHPSFEVFAKKLMAETDQKQILLENEIKHSLRLLSLDENLSQLKNLTAARNEFKAMREKFLSEIIQLKQSNHVLYRKKLTEKIAWINSYNFTFFTYLYGMQKYKDFFQSLNKFRTGIKIQDKRKMYVLEKFKQIEKHKETQYVIIKNYLETERELIRVSNQLIAIFK